MNEGSAELGHRFVDQTKSDATMQIRKEWIGTGGVIWGHDVVVIKAFAKSFLVNFHLQMLKGGITSQAPLRKEKSFPAIFNRN